MKKISFIFICSFFFLSCLGSSLFIEGIWDGDFLTKTELQIEEEGEFFVFGYVYFSNFLSINFEEDGFYKKTVTKKFLKFEKLDESRIPEDFDISDFSDKSEIQEDVGPYEVFQESIFFYMKDGSAYIVQAKINEDGNILTLENQDGSSLCLKKRNLE